MRMPVISKLVCKTKGMSRNPIIIQHYFLGSNTASITLITPFD